MGTTVDFLITYEHKSRELESVLLIMAELERRGYTVELSPTYSEERLRYLYKRKAKVVVSSALYDNDSLFWFVYNIVGYCRKVVNLQWEQILSNSEEEDLSFYRNPKGFAAQAVHLCWGVKSRQRLIDVGVPSDRAVVVGPVHMDPLRPEFSELYLTKEEIAQKFDLDTRKDWVLFISSFSLVNMSDEQFNAILGCIGDRLIRFRDVSKKSKSEILAWIKSAISLNPDKVFIYRPHPSERGDSIIYGLEREFENFRVISDSSVKQWIKVSEDIFTWYSTSVAEVFFANKSCSILRPYQIPYESEVSILSGANFVENKEGFLEQIGHESVDFPVDPSRMRSYYDYNMAVPSYVRICDLLERVINSEEFDMRFHMRFLKIRAFLRRLRCRLSYLVISQHKYLNNFLVRNCMGSFVSLLETNVAAISRVRRDRSKNVAEEQEIEGIYSKIKESMQKSRL